MTSPYALTGARLVDNGYSAIPILPGAKRPGVYTMKEWYGTNDWQRYCDRLPTEIEIELWNAWPDAGVCVALDKRLKVIDIDTDDSELMAAVLSVLPDSEVKKRGKKGFSAFYRGSPAIVSAPFSVGKNRVVDLLAHGRQTVLPPTLHPDTGQPYHWIGSETLEAVAIESLPELPDNVAEQIASALEPWGYEPTQEHHRLIAGEGEGYWRNINDTALKNLDRWVPTLGLKKLRKKGNGYRAVADWRHEINSNAKGEALSIHPEGITDWGTSENYTPVDLVMQATGGDLYHATQFLCDRLGIKDEEDDGFDVAGFIARAMAKQSTPQSALVAPEPSAVIEVVDTPAKPDLVRAPRGTLDPFALANQGGLLQQVTQWILETARVPVAEFATIAALSFLSAFFGRRYVTPTELGLNTYLIGIAGPGFGKDHPRAAIEMLGHESGMSWLIGPNEVTSDSAIEKTVRRRPCFVMPWDEVGVLFQGMTGKNASSWSRSIRKSLLELYSRSTRVWTGKEKADDKTDSSGEPVWFPTVSMLGFSTPTEFYSGITEQNFSDGFMARLTIIGATKSPGRKEGRSVLKTPTQLIENLKKSFQLAPLKGNMASIRAANQRPVLHTCEWGTGALSRWRQIEDWQQSYMDDSPDKEGIVGRSAEQTQKYATLRAISRNPARPVVEVEDVEYGWSIVQKSIDMIDDGVRKHLSGSEHEKLHKLILQHIEEAGGDGISKSVLLRKKGASTANTQAFNSAITYLQDADLIVSKIGTDKTKGGRPGVKYFASSVIAA